MEEKKRRNKEILVLHKKNGVSLRKIGKIYGIHWTTVQEIIKRLLNNEGSLSTD